MPFRPIQLRQQIVNYVNASDPHQGQCLIQMSKLAGPCIRVNKVIVTGRQAVELLLRSIAGEPVPERTPLLPVELIVRDSCGGRKIPTTKERH